MTSVRVPAAAGPRSDPTAGTVWRPSAERDDTVGRLAVALLLALTGLVAGFGAVQGGSAPTAAALVLLLVGALAAAVTPWTRLPGWLRAAPAWWGCAALALAAVDPASASVVPGFALVFLYAGLTLTVTTCATVALGALGLATAAAVVAGELERLPAVALCVAAGLCVGAVVSRLVERHRRVRHELHALLTAVTALGEVADVADAAQVVVDLAVQLLDADGAELLLAEGVGSSRLSSAALRGETTGAREVLDVVRADCGAQLALALRRSVFVQHAQDQPLLAADLATVPTARSVLLAPLPGEGDHLGVLQVWWRSPHQLDGLAEQAVELLARHAGQVLARLRSLRRLEEAAATDPLTGLSNRREFLLALAALRPGGSVVFLDLDHFKSVNDTQGHEAGDEILRQFAAVLARSVRDGDCAARYGGEEFALVLPRGGTAAARIVVNRVRQAWTAAATGTTFSAGLAEHRAGDLSAATLAAADTALYRAKEEGRDRVVVAAQHGDEPPPDGPGPADVTAVPAPRLPRVVALTDGRRRPS